MKRGKSISISEVLTWLLFALALGFLAWSVVSNQNGSYKTFLVQSGSMEPSIMVGDVIVTRHSETYNVNDVITFNDGGSKKVTHRIVEINRDKGADIFATKGDANRSGDRETVASEAVLGKVVLTVPKLGYVVNFLKTPAGFALMVIFPAIWIVVSELVSIKKRGEK